jgi:hypothetical protein
MRALLVRIASIGLPLAVVVACAESGSSSGGTFDTEAGAPFTPDAATTDSAPASPPPPAKAATTVTLDLTPLQPKVGDEVTLTATVSGKTPTGTIQMKDGASDLGAPVALTSGADATSATATFKTTTLMAGPHVVSAVYAGDDDDAASTSKTTTFTVTFPTTLPFDTGLDNARVALADTAVDTHWTVKDASGKALMAYAQTDALGFAGIWMRPSATSKFVSPFIDTVDPGVGPFTYTTTFSLANDVNLTTTTLAVSYASDNATDSITLNGQAIAGVTPGGDTAFVVLPITGPFVVGPNSISFVSSNTGGPTGFRAELTLTTN